MSYLFDASGERITGVFSGAYDYPITLVAWVKRSDAAWAGTADGIIQLSETALDQTDSLRLNSPSPVDRVNATAIDSVDANSAASYTSVADAYNDIWVMVAAVFTSSTKRDVYIETAINTGASGSSLVITGTLDQLMLGNEDTGAGKHVDGLLAECCIWNKALVESEINQLQISGGVGRIPSEIAPRNVIGYWPLDKDKPQHENLGRDSGGTVVVSGATFAIDHPLMVSKRHEVLVPIFPVAAPLTTVFVTDVNTTETWADGDTALPITGTGFV